MWELIHTPKILKDADMFRVKNIFVVLLILTCGFCWPSCVLALNQILNIRHWVAPDHTRVVVDINEDVPFTVDKGESAIVIDLKDTELPSHLPRNKILNKPGLAGFALSPRPRSAVRVELFLPGPVQTNVFKLKKFRDKPYRIVVDLIRPDAARQEREAREKIKVTRKTRVVVIDPGHGGDDPGAVGKRGTLEKNVVLAIAKKLRAILNGKEGYRAFLTRNGDYYVSFNKRLMIAREYGADLFVSIHADAARNRGAGGGSVYCLSTGAASNEAAKILASYENLADVVGGVPNGEGNDVTDPIILDMFQTHTINQSKTFGGMLIEELGEINRIKFNNVQEAPFRVLKLPEIPSVLVETAFISNAKEEKLLRSSRFQTRIAKAVARSIVEFLPPIPPENAAVIAENTEKPESLNPSISEERGLAGGSTNRMRDLRSKSGATYRVKKGDTLASIAKRYDTSVRVLMELNHLRRSDLIYVGQRLVLSTPAKSGTPYRAKRGDTLASIAKRHGTSIRVLMKLNHIEHPDLIYIGQKLVIPD
jgi:N-acetylmuramoyl-L-alanine amidase